MELDMRILQKLKPLTPFRECLVSYGKEQSLSVVRDFL